MYTYDDTIFKTFLSNRNISEKHVFNLMESIKKKNKLEGCPILVSPEMKILDGQHRIAAVRKLNELDPVNPVKIFFWIDNDFREDDIILYNAIQKSWDLPDYMDYHSSNNRHSYKLLKTYVTKYKIPFHSAYNIICNLHPDTRTNMSKKYKRGRMYISPSEDKELDSYFREMKHFINHLVALVRPMTPISPSILWNKNWQTAFFRIQNNLGAEALEQVKNEMSRKPSQWENKPSARDCMAMMISLFDVRATFYKRLKSLIRSIDI